MNPEEFECQARQLEGMRLTQVRSYQEPGAWPAWREFAILDNIDIGVDLIGEGRSFFVIWDNTFLEYGLRVYEGTLLDGLNSALVTNVTRDSRWSKVVGQRITQVRVYWCSAPDVPVDDLEKYPQDIELVFEQENVVLLSAALLQERTHTLVEMSDKVAVLFGQDAISEHALGPYRPSETTDR